MDEGKHDFLAEEVLSPNADKCDTMRLNMFNNHVAQTLILDTFDFPQVFTNFENQVGEYSTSYKKFDEDYEVIGVFKKNFYTTFMILINKTKKLIALHEYRRAINITESYGYKTINHLEDVKVGDKVKKGDVAWRSTSYDENMNFSFGRNLKTVYLSKGNMNFEDSIIISESARKKLVNNSVSIVEVNLNPNDIMLNIYGDESEYKAFPTIGETVKNGEIAIVRRFKYDSFLFELKNKALRSPNYADGDTIFHGDGTIVDIEIFSNENNEATPSASFDDMYNSQLKLFGNAQKSFYMELNLFMQHLLEKYPTFTFSDDFMYLYGRTNAFTGQQPWAKQYKQFSGTVIQFTILNENKLEVGDKITNRYGGKGVVGQILPDGEMPALKDGSQRAEVVLSPFGVIARTNPAQLFELHLTFYAEQIMEMLRNEFLDDDTGDFEALDRMEDIYFDFLKIVSPRQYEYTIDLYNKFEFQEEQTKFFNDLVGGDFLYIHQPPFFGNANFDSLMELYDRFPDIKPYQFQGIQKPLVMGNMYFMKLKHYAFSKFSARSASTLNQINVPNKSQNFKNDISRFSKTPIRLGEMETFNMMILNDAELLAKFNKMYSSSSDERKNMIKTLLQTSNPLDIERIELLDDNSKNNIQEIISEYLKALGLFIERTDDVQD